MRRVLVAIVVLAVVVIGGGLAVFALRGADAPPPPELSEPHAQATASPSGRATSWTVQDSAPTFVGYRVREKYVTIGVADAVGRTAAVTGTATVAGDRVTAADMTTDMTALRSDESRRDEALRGRAIETDRFRTSRFVLTEPFAISRGKVTARGRLTLHGRTKEIAATVQGQRIGNGTIELAGAAPIDLAAFAIDPPSVAGFVTVEDHGMLEFKLRLIAK